MLRFEAVLHDERIGKSGRRLLMALRGRTLGVALAGLVAGSALFAPAVAAATSQDAQPEKTLAPGAAERKVSPHIIASRERREASIAAGEHGPKRPVGQPSQTKTVRPKRH